jgi:para-aminobenzoate synthetase component I
MDSSASVAEVSDRLSVEEGPAVLESSAVHETFGRYSVLACRPIQTITLDGERLTDSRGNLLADGAEAFWPALSRLLRCVAVDKPPAGAPADGENAVIDKPPPAPYEPGWIGYIGYEVGRLVERLPCKAPRDTPFPDMRLAFYDALAVHDAAQNRWFLSRLAFDASRPTPPRAGKAADVLRRIVCEKVLQPAPRAKDEAGAMTSDSPCRSNFTPEEYRRAVARCVDYIAAGDIFQANLSQRLTIRRAPPPWAIYRRLRARNPAWHAAYLAFRHAGRPCAIAGSSPELFLRVRGRDVVTRPIKGTRPRVGEPLADARSAAELKASPKDNAELVMIVDLLRNDLGRVCEFGSVRVAEACRLEAHPTVFHLVGTVRGRLRADVDAAGLLRATFPGGSITGAPKVRAMEIIDELEPAARGVYTGCVGWVGVGGDSEWNIAIRTVVCEGSRAHVQVGGGIVADSQPAAEYQETLDKARAQLEAISLAQAPVRD